MAMAAHRIARGRTRAGATGRHRPRCHRRRPARRRRARHRRRCVPHGPRRRAAGRRPGHLPDAARRAIDVVTFTSPSAVRNFAEIYGKEQTIDLLKNTVVAAIGPVTAEAAHQLGIEVTVQPTVSTIPALVDAIAMHVCRRGDNQVGVVTQSLSWQTTTAAQTVADAPAAAAAPHRGHPLAGARNAADARLLHLPAVRLRRRAACGAKCARCRACFSCRWTRP